MMRFRQILATVLVALVALGWLGGSHGMVLCLSSEGHARIELPHNHECAAAHKEHAETPESAAPLLASPDHGSCHAGSCVDIPLGATGPAKHKTLVRRASDAPEKTPVASIACALLGAPAQGITSEAEQGRHVLGDAHKALQTIVLLT